MRIMFDIDGTFCHCSSYGVEKISKKISKKNIPWPIIFLGLLLTNREIDEEMIEIANEPTNDVFINSARPKQAEKYTKKFLQKNGAKFFREIECFGTSQDIIAKKVANALSKRVDMVVDDDEEVLRAVFKVGIVGCSPRIFKKLYNSGVIK